MEKEMIYDLVKGYLKRAKKGSDEAKIYPLVQKGLWRVVGGVNGDGSSSGLCTGNRYLVKNELVRGRFIDAVAYAVQQSGFCAWYCSMKNAEDMFNPNHGYVQKVVPIKPKVLKLAADKNLSRLAEAISLDMKLSSNV